MTTTSRDKLICECGYECFLKLRENDQPFSSLWESYTLEGFQGGSITITNNKDVPQNLLAHLNPKCPKCGETGKVRYAKRT